MLLFGATDSGSDNGTPSAQAEQHLNGCAACQSMAERYRKAEDALRNLESGNKALTRGRPAVRSAECPAEEVWLSLAAGLIEEDKAALYISHAATCDWCGPLLKESMEDLAQDVTPEEQKILDALPTASLDWQREMGRELARAAGASVGKKEKQKLKKDHSGFGWWPKLAWAGAGLAVLAAVAWFTWL
ncbi:MAG TPA: hypothetical protein VIK39_05775, partial [Candidatus Angelobacter sp.]